MSIVPSLRVLRALRAYSKDTAAYHDIQLRPSPLDDVYYLHFLHSLVIEEGSGLLSRKLTILEVLRRLRKL